MTAQEGAAGARIVIMGVSGSGKSAAGSGLAEALGGRFVDGDDLHPEANVAKMSRGEALTDADRWPWLALVAEVLRESPPPVVVACSALKRAYRDRIREEAGCELQFLLLDGPADLLAARLAGRHGHFMPTSLLQSQLDTLERPEDEADAAIVSIAPPLDVVTRDLASAVRGLSATRA
ncbi:gluconokinase [Pseudoroseicyclus aestuarii]|uniref:Gluconokinase n=1 Tax=Pseudoroseicyclus aestuarii TaxID=1795041 RepID=A0A318SZV0_9RHOB|nr:gluconokinase [Pseudoroseicyclus aestuarii]PYE82347.1 gluconate kinase (SKI family) [Pseudoroseicyclus aestuarii]